jgi:hypothetical protein
MGWSERPLHPGGDPAAQLAYEMVELRRKAKPSLKELAKLANYTVSALTQPRCRRLWRFTIRPLATMITPLS